MLDGPLVPDPSASRDFVVRASFIAYLDNYLEGLHIPYVHGGLARSLDYSAYRSELFEYSSLQVGIAAETEDAFDFPSESPDAGQRVAGYYFWLFPNIMFNFYPWGLSLNVVTPIAPEETRVAFRAFVSDPARRAQASGAGGALDQVEAEDEAIVERVQAGLRARLQRPGRYAPTREAAVHHFHRLLVAALTS
jgi:choline monooxygenase